MTALPLNAWVVPFVAALLAGALAVFILMRPWVEMFHRRVAIVLFCTALVEGAGLVRLGPHGWVVHGVLLVGLVLALAQLESVLRASRDPIRFRIKFVILGMCAIAGFELYVASQTLLLGAWRVHYAALSGIVALVTVGLVAFGLGRLRLARTLGRVPTELRHAVEFVQQAYPPLSEHLPG